MAARSPEEQLIHHVQAALRIADDLKLWTAAAALDQALIALTGVGMMPPDADMQLGADEPDEMPAAPTNRSGSRQR